MANIAIILARGGSKRIPRKNIKLFLGKPIIKYSIDAAIKSKCFDEIMVSTEDREIANISLSLGAKVPFLRSIKNASDWASDEDTLLEVLSNYHKRGKKFKYLCLMYATAPFILPKRLKIAMKILRESEIDSVYPVVRFGYPIQRALKISHGWLKRMNPKYQKSRSQDLMLTFHDCGQFYCIKTKVFLKQKVIITKYTKPLIIPEIEVQDIDILDDWKMAEMKYKFLYR